MNALAEISLWFLWVLVVVLYLLVLLLYRQWGLSLVSASERVNRGGLDLGERVPPLADLVTSADPLGNSSGNGWVSSSLYAIGVFLIPNCPICSDLKDELATIEFGDIWPDSHVVLIERIDDADQSRIVQTDGFLHIRFQDSDGAIFSRFDVQQAPFAFVISADERVQAKGVVNTVDAISTLVERANEGLEPEVIAHDRA